MNNANKIALIATIGILIIPIVVLTFISIITGMPIHESQLVSSIAMLIAGIVLILILINECKNE